MMSVQTIIPHWMFANIETCTTKELHKKKRNGTCRKIFGFKSSIPGKIFRTKKERKSREIAQDYKASSISPLAYFLMLLPKFYFLEGE